MDKYPVRKVKLPSNSIAHTTWIGPGSQNTTVVIDADGADRAGTPDPIRPGDHFMAFTGQIVTHLLRQTTFNADVTDRSLPAM